MMGIVIINMMIGSYQNCFVDTFGVFVFVLVCVCVCVCIYCLRVDIKK